MYERYHIPKKETPPIGAPLPKFDVVRDDRCMNCGRCERACVYKVHERDQKDPRQMAAPKSHLCKSCLRCVESCPQKALSVELSPRFSALGSGVWTPQRVMTIWNEALTGKIPVFGAGYRGRFVGPGYDSMWTDMSEIVRPTRDGIHGREFISTSVDLGKRVDHLEFDEGGRLLTKMPNLVEIPIPMVLDVTRMPELAPAALEGVAQAAKALGTLLVAPASLEIPRANGNRPWLVPVIPAGGSPSLLFTPSMLEVEWSSGWRSDVALMKNKFPQALVGIRLEAMEGIEEKVLSIAPSQVDFMHLLYDEQGKELDAGARHAKDSLISINRALASRSQREALSVIAGGGLAAAEHVPKSLICGADAVTLEQAARVALGCQACASCDPKNCPTRDQAVSAEWAKWRVLNMVGAWRDQLLEVLGAMGIREARRLRGETGRAIFYEEAERDAFAGIQGGI